MHLIEESYKSHGILTLKILTEVQRSIIVKLVDIIEFFLLLCCGQFIPNHYNPCLSTLNMYIYVTVHAKTLRNSAILISRYRP